MAVSMNFRSAFNGFNREDVVNYIEYISAKHTAEVNQLNSEIEYLKGKQPAGAQEDTTALQSRIAELEARCAELEQAEAPAANTQELENRCAQLEAQLKQFQDEKAQADAATATQQNHVEQELEAYRRAERVERMAQERAALTEQIARENAQHTEQVAKEYADLIYAQANAALADATVKVDTAAGEINRLVEQAMQQLSQLQSAVTGSKKPLADAAASMYAIRSSENK